MHVRTTRAQTYTLTQRPVFNTPTLLAMWAGESAFTLERLTDEEAVNRTMEKLRQIYGDKCKEPLDYAVTRWGKDSFALGSYSYVSVEASGADYDLLAQPVAPHCPKPAAELGADCPYTGTAPRPTLFFAGEHTMRFYPATVHGALLSGLREAARVAEHYIDRTSIYYAKRNGTPGKPMRR
eukprot:Colp12_sorted_trinity150504_noHs@314